MTTILIVEDHQNTAEAIYQIVEGKQMQGLIADSAEKAFDIYKATTVDLIITDMKLPGKTGLDFLKQVREVDADIPVIVITAFATVQNAVEAMKVGAFDYITKPFTVEEIEVKIDKALDARELVRKNRILHWENEYLREEARYHFSEIVGQSPSMQQIYGLVKKVAPANSPVLILGESGTGKELIARAVHYSSPRKNSPFVKVNCAALAEGVLESELFGHEKGAFTGAIRRKPGRFEIAAEGTIFLDEISEIPPSIQVKLLRVLQEKEFERVGGTETLKMKARLIAATNQKLEELISKKLFREDLYYRLNVVSLHLPPLRERSEDIPPLVHHFIGKYNQESGKKVQGMTPAAMKFLLTYTWPGNIRELENVIERAIVLTGRSRIDIEDLPQNIINLNNFHKDNGQDDENLIKRIEEYEKHLIFNALMRTRGNISQAAQYLGIKRTTLRYKMEKYDLLRYDFA
ncbi:MAG: sigma-54-dependent Fis family transcriptional regulator [Calditrichaeota bacterium]|nr:sigma-54-dependent Fis family transcriptional regulator [Calditrichota bacterium]